MQSRSSAKRPTLSGCVGLCVCVLVSTRIDQTMPVSGMVWGTSVPHQNRVSGMERGLQCTVVYLLRLAHKAHMMLTLKTVCIALL